MPSLTYIPLSATAPKAALLPPDLFKWSDKGGLRGRTVYCGGTFSPPTLGHYAHWQYCHHFLEAKTVLVGPVAQHAEKRGLLPFSQRQAMCSLAVADLPYASVCDVEEKVWRLYPENPGQTYNTMTVLREAYPNIALAIGSDLVADLPNWGNWSLLLSEFPVAVVGRPASHGPAYNLPHYCPQISSTEVREYLLHGGTREGLEKFTMSSVADYIFVHSLYGAGARS